MTSEQPPLDPHYQGPAARYLRAGLTYQTRYDVRTVDAHLTDRVIELDHDHAVIRVRPGLSLTQFRGVITGAVLYILGGPTWAPDFSHVPRLRSVPEPGPSGCERCGRTEDRGLG